ncbi:ECF transporter S component [Clostridium grantii]|uniref:Uncharacterized membrane protein n=1 Tax=Clostridium grantii DSM 8605 TaxID=1121316 RepID=A0A1M5VQ38_9CLOT|nr:ECF transporter S component [Clostridium grantii]SHH77288.1 Uncharacterized membrane protein [Clostridium grantii DSM 8605]
MEQNSINIKHNSKVKELTISALSIALVFVATTFINIRLPISVNGGLIHLGNTMLFTIAIVFGKKRGAISGAFGMAMFDVFSGWGPWAPFTFIIRGTMGYIIGHLANDKNRNGNSLFWNIVSMLLAGLFMIPGYYITEGLLYGNWVAPLTSVPGNIIQSVFGIIFGLPLSSALIKIKIKNFI